MDQGLKERLVGAVVLVALGVVVIPWVLDGGREPGATSTNALRLPAPDEPLPVRSETLRVGGDQAEEIRTTPLAAASATPPAVTTPVETAAAPVAAANESSAAEVALADARPTPESPASAAAAKPDPAPQETVAKPEQTRAPAKAPAPAAATRDAGGWVVQLGSFGEEDNARRLAQRVSTYGYKPDISNHRAGGRVMYRVRVGSYASRPQADATASSLAAHGFVAQVVAAD